MSAILLTMQDEISVLLARFKKLREEYSDVGAMDAEVLYTFNHYMNIDAKTLAQPCVIPGYSDAVEFWQLYYYKNIENAMDLMANQRAKQCADQLMDIFRLLYTIKFNLLKSLNFQIY